MDKQSWLVAFKLWFGPGLNTSDEVQLALLNFDRDRLRTFASDWNSRLRRSLNFDERLSKFVHQVQHLDIELAPDGLEGLAFGYVFTLG